jgi:hypothetical protein
MLIREEEGAEITEIKPEQPEEDDDDLVIEEIV